VADHATGFLSDAKVLDAVEACGLSAVVTYLAVRDASWRNGRREVAREVVRALPRPYVFDAAEAIAALQSAGLLDAEGCIPAAVWESWFGKARDQRAALRGRWDRANKRRRDADSAVTARSHRGDNAVTARSQRGDSVLTATPSLPPPIREGEDAAPDKGRAASSPEWESMSFKQKVELVAGA
jgi:hypothetical protein